MVDESNPVISRFTNKIKGLINNKADKTNATQSNAGLMSAEDKTKLDEMSIQIIDEGTEINNDGIYLIDKPVFMKALTTFRDSSQYLVKIFFPTDNTTNLIIDWGDGSQDKGTVKNYEHTYNDITKKYNLVVKGNIKSLSGQICQGDVSEIELKQNITCPGELTSSNSTYFTKIILPKNISIIPDGFCANQSQLQAITIPNSVTTLNTACFLGCTGLTSITIPDSVTILNTACFQDCTGLTSIAIPDSVTILNTACFQGCTGLTSITIPNSVTTLDNSCFKGCTGLTSITIPDSVTTLGSSCFQGCTGLTSITIPDSVTTLGSSCFQGCTGLTSITIPDSVTTIGNEPFIGNCTNLSLIKVYWTSLTSQLKNNLKLAPRASKSQNLTWEIPSGTTELYSSFLDSSHLVERGE